MEHLLALLVVLRPMRQIQTMLIGIQVMHEGDPSTHYVENVVTECRGKSLGNVEKNVECVEGAQDWNVEDAGVT